MATGGEISGIYIAMMLGLVFMLGIGFFYMEGAQLPSSPYKTTNPANTTMISNSTQTQLLNFGNSLYVKMQQIQAPSSNFIDIAGAFIGIGWDFLGFLFTLVIVVLTFEYDICVALLAILPLGSAGGAIAIIIFGIIVAMQVGLVSLFILSAIRAPSYKQW